MPNTDFQYEEFEGLLGSFHLSLLPLKNSANPEDQRDYQRAMGVLDGFAQRYSVQSPEAAVKNPRAKESWGKAHAMSIFSTVDMLNSFWHDFGVATDTKTEDGQKRYELARLILGVYDRHKIAEVEHKEIDGTQVPVRIKEWDREKSDKTLADILSA